MKKPLYLPLFFIAFSFFLSIFNVSKVQAQVACTADVKLCEDGSYVARSAPDCSFAPCPEEKVFCQSVNDCASGEICYQPPMPECPEGMACAQVMPQKYCKTAPDSCSFYPNGEVACPVWDPAPNFCENGTIVPGGTNECGCSQPPTCENELLIIEDSLPESLNFTPISTTTRYPEIFELDSTFTKVSANGEIGYARGFSFSAQQGENLETLVTEMETATQGSYIRTHLYDPNKQRIASGDTRIQFTVSQPGTFYLIANTFGEKEGKIGVQAFDRDEQLIKSSAFLVGDDTIEEVVLPTYGNNVLKIGAFPFYLTMSFPDEVTLGDDGTLEYFSKTGASTIKVRPTLYSSETDGIISEVQNKTATNVPISITKTNPNEISISPTTGDYFPSLTYALVSERVFEQAGVSGMNFYTYFTTEPEGPVADLNNDGKVNIQDFTILNSQLMQSGSLSGDLNKDGKVNLMDFTIMMSEFEVI